jgi:ankyrin repeat protein
MAGSYVGFTPLHTAIYFGNVSTDTIEELLKRGADVNITNQDGQTALQMATEKGLTDVVELLIQYGAEK